MTTAVKFDVYKNQDTGKYIVVRTTIVYGPHFITSQESVISEEHFFREDAQAACDDLNK